MRLRDQESSSKTIVQAYCAPRLSTTVSPSRRGTAASITLSRRPGCNSESQRARVGATTPGCSSPTSRPTRRIAHSTLGLEDDAMGVKDPRAEGDRRPRRPRHVRRSAPGSERCFVRMGGPAGSALLPSTPCHLGGEVAPARKAVLPGDGELGRREVQAFGHDASSDVRVRVRARRKTALPMRGTSTARWTPSFARTRWRPRTRPRCYLGSRAEARSASAGDCHPSRGITYHPHGGTPTAAGSAGGVLRASRAVWTPLRLHDAQSQCSSGSGQRGIEGGHLSVHLLGREEYAAVRHLETGRSPQAGQAHRSVRV